MKRFILTLVAFVVLAATQLLNAQSIPGKLPPLGKQITGSQAAVSWGPNRLDLFARGLDGAVWHKSWDGFQWAAGWESLGGQMIGSIAAVSPSANRLDVLVRGTDDAVWRMRWNGAQWATGWESLRGKFTGAPVALTPSILAQRISQKGDSYQDINQGNAGTCWILGPMAAVQARGNDLTKRIRYAGKNQFLVTLYTFNNPAARATSALHAKTVRVYFDGRTSGADPVFNPSNPRSAWAAIMQRAVIQAVHAWDSSQTIENPHGGWGGDALAMLTGRPPRYLGVREANARRIVMAALAARKSVVFGTGDAAAPTLGSNHDWAVLGASNQGVTLYNPYGSQSMVSWNVISKEGLCFFIQR